MSDSELRAIIERLKRALAREHFEDMGNWLWCNGDELLAALKSRLSPTSNPAKE